MVATPIGNLGDVSRRALDVLARVDRLLAEDTRRTRKLLAHAGIRRRLEAFHEHNEHRKAAAIVADLLAGQSAALVSDAGTPAISDPGYRLIRACIDAGVRVVPIPGPSAPIAALIGSGLPTDRFLFTGYAPRKARERERFFTDLATVPATLVILESPLRLIATLEQAAASLGADRPAAVARELTKAHEEFIRGSLADLLEALHGRQLRGEVTVCVAGAATISSVETDPAVVATGYAERIARGLDRRTALRETARDACLPRRAVYRILLDLKNDREPDP